MTYCEDCGCKVFSGACVNCHEEIYIEAQYFELDEYPPESISKKARDHEKQIKLNPKRGK
jgi:hypothetical protein